MALMRPKNITVYNSCHDYWMRGPVKFVAHAVRTGGVVENLAREEEAQGGSPSPENHPDQVYWGRVRDIAAAGLVRIDVDCTLMPCDNRDNSCLFVVPAKIAQKVGGGGNIAIRFFAHRNEGLGHNSIESKRYFDCHSGMTKDELKAAYNTHQYWKWAHLGSTQFTGRTYDQI